MKIVIWRGCQVMHEYDIPDANGPDIHLDPWNLPESISVRRMQDDGTERSETVVLKEIAR